MRKALLIAVLFLPALSVGADDDLGKIRARADAANPKDCTKVCAEAAEKLVDQSSAEFDGGNAEAAHKALEDAIAYSRRAASSAIETRKRQKQVEIDLRKIVRRIDHIKDTLNFEDRPRLEEHIKELEGLRDELLASMFGPSVKKAPDVPKGAIR